MIFASALLLLVPVITGMNSRLLAQEDGDWSTDYERSGGTRSPRYAETLAYCQRLDDASPWIRLTSFGRTPQGRDLPLVILSSEQAFDPRAARASGKAIILIQSGIHAGEIDGKDASLMLMRDIAITRRLRGLLDGTIALFVPIFNVDGHERVSRFNRINQNGPEETGWRTTAQNLNLNRDYMKADAPEMRAMLRLFNEWLPDFSIDCHVTDGIDFQYTVTYAMEVYQNIDPAVASWSTQTYLPTMTASVEAAGHPIAPYIWPREDRDITTGFATGAAPPRFSTGYAALHNRPALLIETHMLKPYRTRVDATYQILKSTLEILSREGRKLCEILTQADERTKALASIPGPVHIPIRLSVGPGSKPWLFKGVKALREFSEISGAERTIYTTEPEEITVPHFAESIVVDSVRVPRFYLIPPEWTSALDVLRTHGIAMKRLATPLTLRVERLRLTEPAWQTRSYEGRHPVRFKTETFEEEQLFPAGTWVVPVGQRSAQVAIHLLEPRAPDSFAAWGFFDAVFEQKEYAEPYVMEQLARQMIARDPKLLEEFQTKLAADSAFSASPYARLEFFFRKSPYWDATVGLYPVARVIGDIEKRYLRE